MVTNLMEDFIHDIRTDRKREIAEYKAKDYSISSNYLCLSKVDIICNNMNYCYNVQVDNNEIKFLLSNDMANLYLSLYEIYELVHNLPDRRRAAFKTAFKKHILNEATAECHMLYKGIRYKLYNCVVFPKAKICLDTLGLEIESPQLYFLIHLIQSKSNSMFERSKKEENKAYINGIYRLYSALLRKKSEAPILYNKGWLWDPNQQAFVLDSKLKERDATNWKKKYYLTEEEYNTILKQKKS